MKVFQIEIPLRGVSKGSTRAFRGVIIDSNHKKIKLEESLIRMELSRTYPKNVPSEGPCFVLIHCGFSRPKNQFTAKGAPSKNFKTFFTSTPDADKCARTVLDALTGYIFKDDRQAFFVGCLQTFSSTDFIKIQAFTDVQVSEIPALLKQLLLIMEDLK